MLPLTNAQLQQNLSEAVALINQRKLPEAAQKLQLVLQNNPKAVGAHFQMARIHMMRAEAEKALEHLEVARMLKPQGPNIWRAYAEVLANAGTDVLIKQFLAEAKQANLPPDLLLSLQDRLSKTGGPKITAPALGEANPADVQRAIDLVQNGRPAEAETLARALRVQHPDVALIALILANALGSQMKYDEARGHYEAAVRLAPDYPEARNTYGRFLMEFGEYERAEGEFRAALQLRRDMPQALVNYAMLLGRLGRYPLGVEHARRAVRVEPKNLEAYLTLGRLLSSSAREMEAVETYEQALENGLKEGLIYSRLGTSYTKLDQYDKAMECFNKAVESSPEVASVYSLRAMHFQELGQFEDAKADFRKALELQPDGGETYRNFVAIHKLKLDDPIVLQLKDQLENAHLSDANRMQMNFAMARVTEQNKAHDQVFTYLRPANDLMRQLFPYDINSRRVEIDKIKTAMSGIDYDKLTPVEGASDFAPIFVTGMPRSGTTLVEQILASHSRVDGAGENSKFIGNLSLTMNQGTPNYRPLEMLADDELREVGRIAEESLRNACPGAERVVDKAIQTYVAMGAVKRIFPKAHVVLVRRDPRDCLLSIYKNMFVEGTHRYAYNQRDLGLYYRMFEEMVEFWREKAPGSFYEIQYEDLIDNPEDETRKLLGACDLEWEDACLNFHENKRKVATLSVAQVRQPIYKSSQAAWKRYEDELSEMIEALGDAV